MGKIVLTYDQLELRPAKRTVRKSRAHCILFLLICFYYVVWGFAYKVLPSFLDHPAYYIHTPWSTLSPICRFLIRCAKTVSTALVALFVTHLLLHHHLNHPFTDVFCGMYNILSTFYVAIMLHAALPRSPSTMVVRLKAVCRCTMASNLDFLGRSWENYLYMRQCLLILQTFSVSVGVWLLCDGTCAETRFQLLD